MIFEEMLLVKQCKHCGANYIKPFFGDIEEFCGICGEYLEKTCWIANRAISEFINETTVIMEGSKK